MPKDLGEPPKYLGALRATQETLALLDAKLGNTAGCDEYFGIQILFEYLDQIVVFVIIICF